VQGHARRWCQHQSTQAPPFARKILSDLNNASVHEHYFLRYRTTIRNQCFLSPLWLHSWSFHTSYARLQHIHPAVTERHHLKPILYCNCCFTTHGATRSASEARWCRR
jgi:hypothetical protein